MELYQLRYFCSVAKHENITKAAEELHVSQPALSRSIRRLEEELGVGLFDRVGRHIELNDRGRVFLRAAEGAIKSVDSVGQTLDRYVREQSSTLNVRNPCYFGDDAAVLGAFARRYPGIYLRCASEPTPFLDVERPDLTFFASFARHEEPNCCALGQEDLVVSVPLDHPLADEHSVRLADLRYEKFVTVLPSAVRSVIDGMFAEAGFEPHVVLEDQHCWMVNQYVAQGLGIAIAPAVTWFSAIDRERVRSVPISDVKRRRTLYLKWPEGITLSPAAESFKEYLGEYYRGLDACITEP